MKYFVFFLITCIGSVVSLADENAEVLKGGTHLPKIDLRLVLQLISQHENKLVVVDSEEVLKRETSIIIPGELAREDFRKILDAIILLEGYALEEHGEELHVIQILSAKQCDKFNEGLGRVRPAPIKELIRQRTARGRSTGKQTIGVVVRPQAKADEDE